MRINPLTNFNAHSNKKFDRLGKENGFTVISKTYEKPRADIKFNGERLYCLPVNGNKSRMPTFTSAQRHTKDSSY